MALSVLWIGEQCGRLARRVLLAQQHSALNNKGLTLR